MADLSEFECRLTADEYAAFMRAVENIQTAIQLSAALPPSHFAEAVRLEDVSAMYDEWVRSRYYLVLQRAARDSLDKF